MSPFVGCLLLLTGPAELVERGGGRGRLSLEEFSAVVEGGDCEGKGSIEGGVGGTVLWEEFLLKEVRDLSDEGWFG